jgi:HEAT repeat protein
MLNPETFAVQLARALELFRTGAPKEDQKQQFRVLVGLLKDGGVLMSIAQGRLVVNGTAVDVPQVEPLCERLRLHGVTEMVVPHDAPVAHVYELLKALSDPPAAATPLNQRLKETGASRLSVSLKPIDLPLEPPPPPAFASGAGSAVAADVPPELLGTEGLLRGDPMKEYDSAPVEGTGDIVKETDESPVGDMLPRAGSAEVSAASYDLEAAAEPEPAPLAAAPEAPPPPPPEPPAPPEPSLLAPPPVATPQPVADIVHEEPLVPAAATRLPRISTPEITKAAQKEVFAAAAARAKTTEEVLAELEREPTAPSASDTLAVLSRQVEAANRGDKIEESLKIVDGIIRIEGKVPEGARRGFTIAVKRVLSKELLQAFGKLAGAPVHREAVLRVLSRGGDDGVEILVEQLANSPTIEERRNLFAVLGQMKRGQEQLILKLNHHQWFVVRNVAELLGELGLEGSAVALSKQLAHPDERVRGAVALALAKIGTAGAVEPLRRALRDPSGAVRRQVAVGVGGRKAGALAMPIVVAIEQEQDQDVARELMLALGRIGSPDAVQALIKFAQPGGKLFGRKPTSRRLAAVEALRVAATPAAIGTLQGLADDAEKEVKSAATAALAELKR